MEFKRKDPHYYELVVDRGAVVVMDGNFDRSVGDGKYFSIALKRYKEDTDPDSAIFCRATGELILSTDRRETGDFLQYRNQIENDTTLPEDLKEGLLELFDSLEEREATKARRQMQRK